MPAKVYKTSTGVRVPSVSTICKHVDPPGEGLLMWAHRVGMSGQSLDEARESAAGIGTIAHACVEGEIRGQGVSLDDVPAEMRTAVEMSLAAWRSWRASVEPVFLATETSLVSDVHRFGGTSDFVCTVGGVVTLGDVKTGRLYPSALAQVGGYAVLWDEHHPDQPIERCDLLRLDKATGAFTWCSVADVAVLKDAFLHARKMYGFRKELQKLL